MTLEPGESIGTETHQFDQFFRIESGEGKAILNGIAHPVSDGYSIVVPAGVKHNLVNTSSTKSLKLYTLYAPPAHIDGKIHQTKAEAEKDDEHFDGKTTE